MALTPVITDATPADIPEARAMLDEYARWLGVDLCFQNFAEELAGLPGAYAPPTGAILIARFGSDVVGMVAFRRRDDTTAEMKRLYVRPAARGTGVGHLLVERVIIAARAAGYGSMVLDTLPVMASAQRLYEAFGFKDMPPYYESPIAGTRYMALSLSV
jgi:ribosomal protein S18 acetylase RimI-like enzyme